MLTEISKYENLGNPDEICYVMKNILSNAEIKIDDISAYCLHNVKFTHIPILGILAYLKFIRVLEEQNNKVVLTENGKMIMEANIDNDVMCKMFVIQTIKSLQDGYAEDFIDYNRIKYDINFGAYVNNSDIPLKYSGLRNLLIDMKFFLINLENTNILIISSIYNHYLKDFIQTIKKRVSLNELKNIFEYQEQIGLEAELYVIDYENQRLSRHPNKEKIIQISQFDVSAGYDIASFNNEFSIENDRFIEVKSFQMKEGFFWSKNEVEVAKLKRDSYYLYLVNREKMKDEKYEPIIIKNPFVEIYLNDAWIKEAQSFYIYKY